MINNKLTYITLFSSAGVGCYGFKEAGYECIATNELIEKRLNIQKNNKKCKYKTETCSLHEVSFKYTGGEMAFPSAGGEKTA